jgi:hypothetical protein
MLLLPLPLLLLTHMSAALMYSQTLHPRFYMYV